MRRISEGNNSSYTLPPPSSHSLQEQESNGDKSSLYHSTFSYSYPPQQHEEYYYPVYNKHEWSEDDSFMPMIENSKIKKKKEMDERMKEINREFLDNRENLYGEKVKQLQDELLAVEKGQHEFFDTTLADLDEKRRETIKNAKLMMIYQLSTVDEQCNLNYKKVQSESLAEQKELQHALFTIIEEKRKKLKQEKDSDVDAFNHQQQQQQKQDQHHQTRNRKRLSRKKGDADTSYNSLTKKKQDRLKENPSHLIGVLTHVVEQEIAADYYEMTRKK